MCVSVGPAPSQAALFEFRSQADKFLAGLCSRSQPRREGVYQGQGPSITHLHGALAQLWYTHTCTDEHWRSYKGILNYANGGKLTQRAIQTAITFIASYTSQRVCQHIHNIHKHTHTAAGSHADTTSVFVIPP